MQSFVQYVIEHKETLALVLLLLCSEILPFSEKIRANGLFQAVMNGLKKVAKPKAGEIAQGGQE